MVTKMTRNPNATDLSYSSQHACMRAKLLQLCPTLCNPMDHSLPVSSVHGISQARIMEWVDISFTMGSSPPVHGNKD